MIQTGNSFISFPISEEPIITSNIKYGRLYNWFAASNSLFAPIGWHVPTQAEFEELSATLGNDSVAGGKLKEIGTIYWADPNSGASNEANYYGRGSGIRRGSGIFQNIGILQYLRSSTINYIRSLDFNSAVFGIVSGVNNNNITGGNIRPVKDDSTLVSSLVDLDGNIYRTTKIGNQVWLADNWACTKLNDGTPIPNVTDDTAWSALATGAYCDYNNDIDNVFLP